MWTAAAGLWLLVQVGLSASTPDAACSGAEGTCQVPGAATVHPRARDQLLLQVQIKGATNGQNETLWAPSHLRKKHEHRYRSFVKALLRDEVGCEDKSSFKISAKAVDAQHLKLLALVEQVRLLLVQKVEKEGLEKGLVLSGDELKPLKTLLVWLAQYTVVHFDAEEKTMDEANYMDLVPHKAAHRAFYGEVREWGEIVDEMLRSKGGFHVGSMFVIVDKWLQDHICVQDKRFGAFLERSGMRDAINDDHSPDGVVDVTPDCVPALVGKGRCVSHELVQGLPRPTAPAPEWWVAAPKLAAHDKWYQGFVEELLQSPVACRLAGDFDIAVRAIDSQHHKLLTLVDGVRRLLLERVKRLGFEDGLKFEGRELQPLSAMLAWLQQYGVVHFDAEEQMMEKLGYPDLPHHQALHRAFYGQMSMANEVVSGMMSSGGGFHAGPLFVYVARWFQNHICTLDKGVDKFIGDSGAELSETEDIIPDILPSFAGPK